MRKGGRIAIRIPARCSGFILEISDRRADVQPENGYVYISVADGDEIVLMLDDGARFVYPSPRIPALTGLIAVMRGPLVYCFEGADNEGDVLSLRIDPDHEVRAADLCDEALGNTVRLEFSALRAEDCGALYSRCEPELKPCRAFAIPYYLWGNRGVNQMRVWMGRA